MSFKLCPLLPQIKSTRGFTLIETIVGIVTLSIAFTLISTFLFPAADQSARQVHQIRAAELGQSFINEIMGRAFDENSDMSGGLNRCGEDQDNDGDIEGGELCSSSLGPDSETRVSFDDVDDYIASDLTGNTLLNSIGEAIGDDKYQGYSVSIEVCQASTYQNCDSANNSTAKRITVTVTTPQYEDVVFAVYKGNF